MIGDISLKEEAAFGFPGEATYQVAAGAVASIQPGEPVVSAGLGTQYVALAATNTPVVGTDFMVGIAMEPSTDTVAADGTVKVMKLTPGVIYLIKPNVAATWNTQAKYDALVGNRVLLDLTGTTFTILSTDGANNGLVVENLDIATYPEAVAFSIRAGASYLA